MSLKTQYTKESVLDAACTHSPQELDWLSTLLLWLMVNVTCLGIIHYIYNIYIIIYYYMYNNIIYII